MALFSLRLGLQSVTVIRRLFTFLHFIHAIVASREIKSVTRKMS